MTSRLKRKLGDMGVDPTSAKANESFCLIGTPLPPLEKSKDNGEFVPLWKQDVRDEQGRRRLHGAFTGGFSAGYFNTVGSKEGWTPATFVSSRTDRAKQKGSRPEDFMDDEDLAELREGQKLVDETDEMDFTGGTQAELKRKGGVDEPEKDAITAALETSLLPPAKDSAGARILKKMGWRIGQGIGPRLTWQQRKLQDVEMSRGPGEETTEEANGDDDEEASKHTYAPRDTPILHVKKKDNAHGLGYLPGMGLNDGLGVKGGSAPKGPNLSSGFGLGALNDADEDDLDVYDASMKQPHRHMAYDASEREEDDRIVIGSGGRKRPEQRPTSSAQTFQDGRPVLAGFVLSDKPVAEDRWFPLPEVPKGWSPNPRRIWGKNKENAEPAKPLDSTQPIPHGKWKSGIMADQRGTLLGETPLPSAPRSVFEYISLKDRERIQSAAIGSSQVPASSSFGMLPPPAPPPRSTITVPRMEAHVAQAALRGFQPFSAEPVKHARYTAYLQFQAKPDPDRDPALVPISMLPGQSIDEFNKELADYAKAATIFKPISGAMANRFTSAAIVDNGPKIIEGLHTPTVESENDRLMAEATSKELEVQAKEEESPKAHAARMGMYGRLTREIKPWTPARLLCKRFGVKDPEPEATSATASSAAAGVVPTADEQTGDASMSDAPLFTGTESFRAPTGGGLSGRAAGGVNRGEKKDPSNVGLGEDDDQGRDTLTYKRPAMDIFKAIFASDDEGSDEDDDSKMDEDVNIPTVLLPTKVEAASLSSTSTAPLKQESPAFTTEKVDTGSFKPTFIPRDGKKPNNDKDMTGKKAKKDKKKSERTIVSFEMDEDGEESLSLSIPKEKSGERPKKKRKDKKKGKEKSEVDDDESMWVEKPLPQAVQAMAVDTDNGPRSPRNRAGDEKRAAMDIDADDAGAEKGRKKAVDFW